MRLTLKDDGYSFKKIMHGRKWIGRTLRRADGRYVARIKRASLTDIVVDADTELEAFEEAGARLFGHKNAAALREHNAKVAENNARLRRQLGLRR